MTDGIGFAPGVLVTIAGTRGMQCAPALWRPCLSVFNLPLVQLSAAWQSQAGFEAGLREEHWTVVPFEGLSCVKTKSLEPRTAIN